MKIQDLEYGKVQEIEVLVKEVHNGTCRDGSIYQRVTVMDRDGNVTSFMKFNSPAAIKPQDVILAKVETGTYRESISYRLCECSKVEGVNPKDFFPGAKVNKAEAWHEIAEILKEGKHPGLMKLVCAVITENKQSFLYKPLHPTGSFSRECGILEATLKLMQLSLKSADVLGLDKDMLIAGSALYYIGNVDLVTDGYLATEDDVLLGESITAVKKITLADARLRDPQKTQAPLTEELLSGSEVKQLCHLVCSRSSGNACAMPESYVLRYNDAMIQKTDEAESILKDAEQGETVSGKGYQKLYKAKSTVA